MTVKRFSAITTGKGALNVAVVDHVKEFHVLGVGVSEGDMVMFVNAGAEDDSDCESAVNSDAFIVQDNGTVAVLFQQPTTGSLASGGLKLCFKFGEEPYILLTEFQIHVRQILDTDKRLGLSGALQSIAIFGYGMQENDYLGWISQDAVNAGIGLDGGHMACTSALFPELVDETVELGNVTSIS